jgi:hypothetical protein
MYDIGNINTCKSIYFANFHSIVKYGIIFGGNSSESKKIFTLQKKIIRSTAGAQPRTPCRSLFKKIRDFTYSVSIYIFINELYFKQSRTFSNKFIYTQYRHSNKHHLSRPNANLSCFQKSVRILPVTQFSTDSVWVSCLKNEKKKFKVALRKFLNTQSFYSVDEFCLKMVHSVVVF